MQVLEVLGKPSVKKRDHGNAFGNLHHWKLNMAAPNKKEKKKKKKLS